MAHLKSYGITHEKTVAGLPRQNGRAEHWNWTITEKAMAMMHHADLSHGFWQSAVNTVVHIYNHQPMCCLNGQCTITVWDGTIPDLFYFRVFKCKVFVHVPIEQRQGKLNKKVVKMIFVGYEQGFKGYSFWNPATQRIVVSCDVTLDEESFPAWKDLGNNQKSPGLPQFSPADSDSEDAEEQDLMNKKVLKCG